MRERITERESIGVQAARFALYSPVAVLMLGCFTTFAGRQSAADGAVQASSAAQTNVALAWLNVALIVVGFLLGLFALISMRRFGREGILWRASTGIVLNGLLLLVLMSVFSAARGMANQRAQLVGTWHLQSAPEKMAGSMALSLRADGTFDFDQTNPAGKRTRVFGEWVMLRDRKLGISIDRVENANPQMVGQKMGLGFVESVDAGQMKLRTDAGNEVYSRVK
jgi:hypothetical protein